MDKNRNCILIVEDEPLTRKNNQIYFESVGYKVLSAETAAKAWEIVCTTALDCIILDINLPDDSGFNLCARIRQRTGLPIVFLSGYTEEESRIKGLSIGGDDYVCKPYSLVELELRVQARIRSVWDSRPPSPLLFGLLVIEPAERTAAYGGVSVELSSYEFEVLYFLALHPGQVFSYERLFNNIWHEPMNKGIKSLQMVIVRIRQKLSSICPSHEYIQTIRGKGYFFAL